MYNQIPKIMIRPSRPNNEKCVLIARAYFNKETLSLSTGITISPKNWNKKTMRLHNRDRYSVIVNPQIIKFQRNLEDILMYLLDKNRLNAWNVKKALGKESPIETRDGSYDPQNFEEFFDNEYSKQKNTDMKKETMVSYRATIPWLLKYKKMINPKNASSIFISEINNTEFENDFHEFMIKEDLAINTRYKHIKTIKTILNYAAKKGYVDSFEFRDFKFLQVASQPMYLNKDELKAIYECKTTSRKMHDAKDWLLISCYTGLRISDFLTLPEDAIDRNEGLISTKNKKTGTFVYIPIHPLVDKILKSRSGELPQRMDRNAYNKLIKDICKIAMITTKVHATSKGVVGYFRKCDIVSSHVGRRSMATNTYLEGFLPPEKIRLITGHATVKALMRYIAIDRKEVANELRKGWLESDDEY